MCIRDSSGSASFIKSGAAQSYIVSGGNVYRLLSKTVPIGIIRGVDAQRLRFNVKDGDVIVMVSDGITEGDDDCVWPVSYTHLDVYKRQCQSRAFQDGHKAR